MQTEWRRALIVGASSGIGEELARQLVRAGCRVALVARRVEQLDAIARDLNQVGDRPAASVEKSALTYKHDVREYECVPALFQQIAADLGGLDVVIYCAGAMPLIEPDQYDFAKDQLILETNVLGAVAWLNEAAQRFQRAGAGTVVGISSVAGDRGRRGMPVYGASKACLDTYLEALRNRLGQYGVSVVTVKPGPVDTPLLDGLDRKKLPLLISAQRAATETLKAARRGKNVVYVPAAWRPIMWVVRHIPSAVFRKLNF